MKTLSHEFRHAGFHYRIVERDGDVVLLAKRARPEALETFEVCVVRKCADRTIAGKFIPARECLPAAEHWGTYGFAFTTLESARAKFLRLAQCRRPTDTPSVSTARAFDGLETVVRPSTAALLPSPASVPAVERPGPCGSVAMNVTECPGTLRRDPPARPHAQAGRGHPLRNFLLFRR